MKLKIKVIPRARKNLVKDDEDPIKIYLTAPPTEGKANKALVELLSAHFFVPKNKIEIIKGLKSKNKTIIIGD